MSVPPTPIPPPLCVPSFPDERMILAPAVRRRSRPSVPEFSWPGKGPFDGKHVRRAHFRRDPVNLRFCQPQTARLHFGPGEGIEISSREPKSPKASPRQVSTHTRSGWNLRALINNSTIHPLPIPPQPLTLRLKRSLYIYIISLLFFVLRGFPFCSWLCSPCEVLEVGNLFCFPSLVLKLL